MNCHDISVMLDERDGGRLTAADRRAAEPHLKSCAACAAAFGAHEATLGIAPPPLPAGLEARCRRLFAASNARPARRAGSRPFVVGSLLLAGAAAAGVVGLQLTGAFDRAPGQQALSAVGPDQAADADDRAADDASAGPGPTIAPPATIADATGDSPVLPGQATGTDEFTVAVAPLRHETTHPDAVRITETIYVALVEELRKIPNLVLIELEAADDDDDPVEAVAAAPGAPGFAPTFVDDFIETTVSIDGSRDDAEGEALTEFVPSALIGRIETLTNGSMTVDDGDPGSDAMAGVVNVILDGNIGNIRVEMSYATSDSSTIGAEPLPYDYRLDGTGTALGNAWRLVVDGRTRSGQRVSSTVGAQFGAAVVPEEFVTRLVDSIRRNLLPPDDAMIALIEQRVLDTALPVSERMGALGELQDLANRSGFEGLSDDVIFAAVDMLAGIADERQRARVFRLLRDFDNPVLVQPLSDALLHDASEAVRLEAAMSLAGFAADPSARAALALAGRDDASAAVRMNARWASLAFAGRRDYVISSLLDTGLSDAERLAPLAFEPNWNDGGSGNLSLGAAIDGTVAGELAGLIRRADDADMRSMLMMRLGREDSPSLAPLFIERLTDDAEERVRSIAAGVLGLRIDEPGVRFALERARAEDASASVRAAAARVLSAQE